MIARFTSTSSPRSQPRAWCLGTSIGTAGAMIALGLMLAAVSGCYQRVTSARGFGADSVEVSESYQESSRLDDWIFGKDESKSKSPLKRR